MNQKSVDVAIIGAGLAGLSYAWEAKRAGHAVLVLESANEPGGAAASRLENGFLLELGPNTVQPHPALWELVTQTTLKEKVLIADARAPRFVFFQGKLWQVPLSPGAFLSTRLLSLAGRLRILAEPLIPRNEREEESVDSFFRRRLGTEAAERLVAPFVSGVWAGDTKELSVVSAFPRVAALEKESGSILRGLISGRGKRKKLAGAPRGLLSFEGGIRALPEAIAGELGESLILSLRAESLRQFPAETEGFRWEVTAADTVVSCRRLVLAVPPAAAAALLEPIDAAGSAALSAIPSSPLITVHAALDGRPQPLNGFGFLVSPGEETPVLGCLWNSSLFPHTAPPDQSLLTFFVGGARHPEVLGWDDEQVSAAVTSLFQKTLPNLPPLRTLRITRFKTAIPQYTLGHRDRIRSVEEMERRRPGLSLVGNFRGGVAVGEVIESARVRFWADQQPG